MSRQPITKKSTMAHYATCKILEMAENESLSWRLLLVSVLAFMSEDDVRSMAEANGWIDYSDEDEEDKDLA